MGKLLNVIVTILIVLWAVQEFCHYFGGTGNGCTLVFAFMLILGALIFGFITYLYWNEDDF